MFEVGEKVYVTGHFQLLYQGPWEVIEGGSGGFVVIRQGTCRIVVPMNQLSRQDPARAPLKDVREHSFHHLEEYT